MIVKQLEVAYIQNEQFENENVRGRIDNTKFIELFIFTLIMVVVLSGLLFYSWVNYEYIRNQYELRALEDRLRELKYENQKLRLEEGYLSSVDRIEKMVIKELQLRPTDISRIVIIPDVNNSGEKSIYIAQK
jgi:cell division protein FtsL